MSFGVVGRSKCSGVTKKSLPPIQRRQDSSIEQVCPFQIPGVPSLNRSSRVSSNTGDGPTSTVIPHYLRNTESWKRKSLKSDTCSERIVQDDVKQVGSTSRSCKGPVDEGVKENCEISKSDLPCLEIDNPFQSSTSKHLLKYPLIFYSSSYNSKSHDVPVEQRGIEENLEKDLDPIEINIENQENITEDKETKKVEICNPAATNRLSKSSRRDKVVCSESRSKCCFLKDWISRHPGSHTMDSDEPVLVSRLIFPPPANQMLYCQSLSCMSLLSSVDSIEGQDDMSNAINMESKAQESVLPTPTMRMSRPRKMRRQAGMSSTVYGQPTSSPWASLIPGNRSLISSPSSLRHSLVCATQDLVESNTSGFTSLDAGYSSVTQSGQESSTKNSDCVVNDSKREKCKEPDKMVDKDLRPRSPPRSLEAALLDPCSESSVECEMSPVVDVKESTGGGSMRHLCNSDDVIGLGLSEHNRLQELGKKLRRGGNCQANYKSRTKDKVIDGQVVIVSRLRHRKSNSTKCQRRKVSSSGILLPKVGLTMLGRPSRPGNDCTDGGDQASTSVLTHDSNGLDLSSPNAVSASRSCENTVGGFNNLKFSLSWPCVIRRNGVANMCSIKPYRKKTLADPETWTQNVCAYNCCLNCCTPCCTCPTPTCPPVDCTCDNQWRTFSFNCTPSNHLTGCASRGPVILPPDCRNLFPHTLCHHRLHSHRHDHDCPLVQCPVQECPVLQECPCPPRPPPVPPPPVPEKRPPPRPPKRKQPPPRPPPQSRPPPMQHPPSMQHPPPDHPGAPPFYHQHHPPPPLYPPPVCPPCPPCHCPPACCIPCCIRCCPQGRPSRGHLDRVRGAKQVSPGTGIRQMMICCSPMCCCPPCGGARPPGRRKRKLKAKCC